MFRSILMNIRPEFSCTCYASYNRKVDSVARCGYMILKMINKVDKKKHWHLTALANPVTKGANVFAQIHRPKKRQNVLNTLFIRNITDVISTGDIAPEIIGKGVEITEVNITNDYQNALVYWQIPPNQLDEDNKLQTVLTRNQKKIRAELISRNVLGHVPNIVFLRDVTNAKVFAFQDALTRADFGPDKNLPIIPDDTFIEDMFSFKPRLESGVDKKQMHNPLKHTVSENGVAPVKPSDMKSDVLGIDHEALMNEVLLHKKKPKQIKKTAVVNGADLISEDLFSKIPGTNFQSEADRDKLLKQFFIDRKKLTKLTKHKEPKTMLQDNNVTHLDIDCEDPEYHDYINED